MTEEDLIIEKFHACTGIPKYRIREWRAFEFKSSYNIDLKTFSEKIGFYGMRSYEKLILEFLTLKKGHFDQRKPIIQKDRALEMVDNESDLKYELVTFFEKVIKNTKIPTLHITMGKSKAKISNSELVNCALDALRKKFSKLGFDVTPLTFEEVEQIYNEKTDQEWFENFQNLMEYCDVHGNPVQFDELKKGEKYFDVHNNECHDLDLIKTNMFDIYANEHPIKRRLDLKLINMLKSDPPIKRSPGRNEVNRTITKVAFSLADLSRIDEFTTNPEITDIDKIEIKNDTGKFIYAMLEIFGMVGEKPRSFNKKYKPHNYAKNLIGNKLKSKKKDFQLLHRQERLLRLKAQILTN